MVFRGRPRMARRHSQRRLIRFGFLVTALGLGLLLALGGTNPSVWSYLPGLSSWASGSGSCSPPRSISSSPAWPERVQGDISGVSRSVSNLGSSLGVAIAGLLVAGAIPGGGQYFSALVIVEGFAILDCGTDGQQAIAATTAAHNRLGSLSSRFTPTPAVSTPVLMRDQSASNIVFPYPGGAQTKRHLRARTRVQTCTQLRPSHEPRRKRRHRDLHTRYEHHCDQLQSPVRGRPWWLGRTVFPGSCLPHPGVGEVIVLSAPGGPDPIHHQLGRPDPPPGRRRVAMAVAATTRPLCRVSVDASFIGQAMLREHRRGRCPGSA